MAITLSARTLVNTRGRQREDVYHIAAGWADADVIVTRFKHVEQAQWSFTDPDTVAADSVAAEILPATTANPFARIRLQLAGTARAGKLAVQGF